MGEFSKHWMSPHEIYEYFANGPGTDRLDDAQNATRAEWRLEEHRAELIRKQGALVQDGWQGKASSAAFGAVQPLAVSAIAGANLLSRAEDLLDRQSGSFHRAANSLKPVPAEPPKLDITDPSLPFSDYEKQVTSYQADAQHNMDVYAVYDGASEYNQKHAPTYSTVEQSDMNVSVTPNDTQTGDTGDYIEVSDEQQPRGGDQSEPFSRRDPGSMPAGGPPFTGPGPGTGPGPAPGPGPGSVPGPQQQPQQTTPSDFVPRPPSGPFPGGPVPTGPTPGGPGPGGFPPVGFPTSGPGGPGGGRTGGPYGSPGGSPGSGPGSGPGGNNPGPGRGPGMRGGMFGAGALAAEEAAAQRAAAAAARGSGSGMMGAPVGNRGKGDEDEEHQRKVLIEADAEGVFGSDVLTAPQVIGDDEYEDD